MRSGELGSEGVLATVWFIYSDVSRKDGDKGVPSGKILEAYEAIIRKAYLETGNCTEGDIQKFCGFMASKLEGELQVNYSWAAPLPVVFWNTKHANQ